MKLLSAFATASLATAALYAREDVVTTIVTTLAEESTTYVVVDGQTEETVVSGTPSVVELSATETTVELSAYNTHTIITPTVITFEVSPKRIDGMGQFTPIVNGVTMTATSSLLTTWTFPSTVLELVFSARTTAFHFTGEGSTEVIIPSEHTHMTIEGVVTAVDIPGLTTTLTISEATNVIVDLPAVTTQMTIPEATYVFSAITDIVTKDSANTYYCGTFTDQRTYAAGADGKACVVGTTFIVTLPSDIPDSVLYLNAPGITTGFTLPGITTTFVPEQTITIVKDGSTETSVISAVVSTYTTTISGTVSSSGPTPDLPPASNPTYCEVVRGPLTPEEEVQLKVLFSDRAGASAFADYVVSYASQLVAQIADVANIAVGDNNYASTIILTTNNYAFTTAFNTIDIPGILGLASAAPMYTCYLSSLWAQALSNPQQYAKRAVPSQDEKIKLIVLFEKRENSGMAFDYAELLVDETNDLIAEVQNVSAAAANGNLGAYASLFANVDVPYFLSIATEAPIYTEGLSAAFSSALSSYSESVFRPTVTTMTTHTYTTVNTIVTNFVNGTVTVPTTIVSTETVVTVEPVGQVQATSTALQPAPAPAPTANAPVNRVTTEVVTLGNGRVETRTVTVCVENCDTVVTQSTRRPAAVQTVTTRPNVAVYTQVQNGVTYTHTIEIQTKNAALKKVAALGAGILGGAALLL